MRLAIVCVFDRALQAYSRPAFVPSLGVAVRGFTDEVNNPQGEMMKHPGDYDLFHLGEYDDVPGKFYGVDIPVMVVRAVDVLVKGVPSHGGVPL